MHVWRVAVADIAERHLRRLVEDVQRGRDDAKDSLMTLVSVSVISDLILLLHVMPRLNIVLLYFIIRATRIARRLIAHAGTGRRWNAVTRVG